VQLTEAGRKAIERAAPGHVEKVQSYFFDLVSEDELRTLDIVFNRLLENLTREQGSRPPISRTSL
jgi:DNA-binding MarR family transcriptional regulator